VTIDEVVNVVYKYGVSVVTCLVASEFWYPRYVVTGFKSWIDVVKCYVGHIRS
jgi:hypothetical protein